MARRTVLWAMAFCSFIPGAVLAANLYVTPSGAGTKDGSNWDNSWSPDVITWGAIKPGDIILLAGGTYNSALRIGASGAPGNPIYVRRVLSTDSAATAAAGWQPSFDSQVKFNGDRMLCWGNPNTGDYVTVDGRIDRGISMFDPDGPGLVWGSILFGGGQSGVTLKNIEVYSLGGAQFYPFINSTTGIYFAGSGTLQNLLVSHCRFHGLVQAV